MKFAKKSWFKTIAIAVIFCMVATTGAFAASTEKNRKTELFELSQLGITDATPMTDNELKEVEAKFYWTPYFIGAGAGAISGGVGYAISSYGTSAWSWRDLGRSMAYGALGGAFSTNAWIGATVGAAVSNAGMRWGW